MVIAVIPHGSTLRVVTVTNSNTTSPTESSSCSSEQVVGDDTDELSENHPRAVPAGKATSRRGTSAAPVLQQHHRFRKEKTEGTTSTSRTNTRRRRTTSTSASPLRLRLPSASPLRSLRRHHSNSAPAAAMVTPSSSSSSTTPGGTSSSSGGGAAAFFRRVTPLGRHQHRYNKHKPTPATAASGDVNGGAVLLGIRASPYHNRNQQQESAEDTSLCLSKGSYEDDDDERQDLDSLNGNNITNDDDEEDDEDDVLSAEEEEQACVEGAKEDHESPRLGIQRPSYVIATAANFGGAIRRNNNKANNKGVGMRKLAASSRNSSSSSLEQQEIVFERKSSKSSQRAPEKERTLFEQSWVIEDSFEVEEDQVNKQQSKPNARAQEEKKEDASVFSFLCDCDTTEITNSGIEVTYQGAEKPAAVAEMVSPEKVFHLPTAQGRQYVEEKEALPVQEKTTALASALQGIRFSLENGGTTQSTTTEGMWTINPSGSPSSPAALQLGISTIKIFVLLLQPDSKLFELIQLIYPVTTTTIGDILDMIPTNATEPALARQTYIALTRPKKRSPDFTDRRYMASANIRHATHNGATASGSSTSTKNPPNMGLVQGEIILAIPQGQSHYEIVRLGKKILANPRIQKLLEQSNPLVAPTPKKKKSSKRDKNNNNNSSNSNMSRDTSCKVSIRTMEKVEEEEEDSSSSYGTSPLKRYNNTMKRSTSASTASSWYSKPGSLDAFLADTALREQQQRETPNKTNTTNGSKNKQQQKWSPGSTASNSSILDAYLSDSSQRVRAKQRNAQKRKKENESNGGFPTTLLSSATTTQTPSLASYPSMLDAYLSSLASTSVEGGNAPTNTVQQIIINNIKQGDAPHRGPIDTLAGRLTASDSVSLGGGCDDDGSQHSTSCWSNVSAGGRSASSSLHGGSASFVSLTSRNKSRSASAAMAAGASTITAHHVSLSQHRKQLRNKKLMVGMAKLVLALLVTMVLRFYVDPNGFAATVARRNNSSNGDDKDHDLNPWYNAPMGLLGALQVFLLLSLFVKFQRTCEEG